MIITWEELENITGRSKAILSLVSKFLFELPDVCEDGLSVDRALKLLFKMGFFDAHNSLLPSGQLLAQIILSTIEVTPAYSDAQ